MSDGNPKPSGLAAKVDKKRKRQAEESNSKTEQQTKSTGNSASDGPKNKKRKDSNNNKGKFDKKKGGNKGKDNKDKPKQPKEPQETKATEVKGSIDEAIGKMDGRLLADHFAQKVRRHNKEITAVELSDLSVPGMRLSQPYTVYRAIPYTNIIRLRFPRYLVLRNSPQPRKPPRFPESLQPREGCAPG